MKMLTLIVLVISACGPAPFVEKGTGSSSLVTGSPAPIDCTATCFRTTDQLVRDFGFDPRDIHCGHPNFANARDCRTCSRAFEQAFGVTLSSCPF